MTKKNPLPPTWNGYDVYELLSALQKAARRQEPGITTIWALELALSGYFSHAANRLRVIAQEDVGPADPRAVVFASTSLDQAETWHKKKNPAWRMAIANACYALATAKKSRVGDLLQAASVRRVLDGPMPAIPDVAIDKHTQRGRMKGRGLDHFLKHGSRLVGERPLKDYEEKCEEQAIEFWRSDGDRRLDELEQRKMARAAGGEKA